MAVEEVVCCTHAHTRTSSALPVRISEEDGSVLRSSWRQAAVCLFGSPGSASLGHRGRHVLPYASCRPPRPRERLGDHTAVNRVPSAHLFLSNPCTARPPLPNPRRSVVPHGVQWFHGSRRWPCQAVVRSACACPAPGHRPGLVFAGSLALRGNPARSRLGATRTRRRSSAPTRAEWPRRRVHPS